jgi:ergothioneine biosynthesis protein EgtB
MTTSPATGSLPGGAGSPAPSRHGDADAPALARFAAVRGRTEALAAPLSAEDCMIQSMTDTSPAKWNLGHTTWFFETFILETAIPGYQPFRPGYRVIFNSYYNTVGEQHARPQRGMLSRPSLDEVREYRAHVDQQMTGLLAGGRLNAEQLSVVELGLQHEQQHQELLLTDIKHALSMNPLHPAYRQDAAPVTATAAPAPLTWVDFAGGEGAIGAAEAGFCYDNEMPRHRRLIGAFRLASRPVTCGEYQEFMADRGYQRAELWLADGWATVQQRGWSAPLYWQAAGDDWRMQTLGGLRDVPADEPLVHVSYYEADAYARWAGARLPEEAEWEHAAADLEVAGNFMESERFHPAGNLPDEHSKGTGELSRLYGDVWEWTRSAYAPYPGYAPPPGAIGEYNGKFMCNQMVLKGGSCASPASHLRASYRNFFYPHMRWQFSGLRLAQDAG